jgi:hypothetical protein
VTFVKTGGASERIYEGGVAEAGYAPDPGAAETLATAAAAAQGRVLPEGEVPDAAAAIRVRWVQARRSRVASREAGERSCRTSRSSRSFRSGPSSTGGTSESG